MYESRNSAYPLRKELVGKRFLAIEEVNGRGRNVGIENFDWKAGYIRACNLTDSTDRELQVLVEFDGVSWEYRKWWKIHEDTQVFLVEHSIISAQRIYHDARNVITWPAITFVPLVDNLGLNTEVQHPIEFFGDKYMSFVTENDVIPFKDSEKHLEHIFSLDSRVESDLRGWRRLQHAQAFLMNGAVTLTGLRVTVYRLELRQWYTGCITAHNLITRELHVMDDNVLQTHPENPALVQINLLANDDELQRLLHGEQWKVLPVRKHRPSQICLQTNNTEPKTHVQDGIASWHMLREISSSPQPGGWNPSGLVNGGNRKSTTNWNGDKNNGTKRSRRISSRQDMLRDQAQLSTTTITSSNKIPSKPVIIHKPIAVHPAEAAIPYAYAMHSGPSQRLTPPQAHVPTSHVHVTTTLGQGQITPTLHTRPPERTPPGCTAVDRVPKQKANIYDKTQSNSQAVFDNDLRTSPPDMTYTAVKASPKPSTKARNSKQSSSVKSAHDPSKTAFIASSPESKKKTTTQISPGQAVTKQSPLAKVVSCVDKVVSGSIVSSSRESPSHVKTPSTASKITHITKNTEQLPNAAKQTQNKRTEVHASIINTLSRMSDSYSINHPTQTSPNALQPLKTVGLQSSGSNPQVPTISLQSTSVLQAPKVSSQSAGQATTKSGGPARPRPQNCFHKNAISSVQLQHLKLLENLAEYQLQLVRDAFATIKMTRSEEQFFFVVDFFHKLAEGNRDMIDMCGDLAKRRVDEEKAGHKLHETKQDHVLLSRTKQSLPDPVKMKLKTANDEAMSQKEKVLLWVQGGMLADSDARSMRGVDNKSQDAEQRQLSEHAPEIQQKQQENMTRPTAGQETEKQQKSRTTPQKKTKQEHVIPPQKSSSPPQERSDELRVKHSNTQTTGEYLLKQPLDQSATDGRKSSPGQVTRVLNKGFQDAATAQNGTPREVPPLYNTSSVSADQLLSNLSSGTAWNITDNLELRAGNIEKPQDGLKNTKQIVDSTEPKARVIHENEHIASKTEQLSTATVDTKAAPGTKTPQRGDKRKLSEQDVNGGKNNTATKPKRQRRSKKNKNSEVVPSSPVITTVTTSTPQDGRAPVKVTLAGNDVNTKDLLRNTNDRPLLPEKVLPPEAAPEINSDVTGYYHPRSITKGIGFVPNTSNNKTNNKTSGTMPYKPVKCGLDVLASVSASLSNSEETSPTESGKTNPKQKRREKKKNDGQIETKKKKHGTNMVSKALVGKSHDGNEVGVTMTENDGNKMVTNSSEVKSLTNAQTTSADVLNDNSVRVTTNQNNYDEGKCQPLSTGTTVNQTTGNATPIVTVSLEALESLKPERIGEVDTEGVEAREEAKENRFGGKSIIFVNDASISSFVKANGVAEDNVFKECLISRKKQHNKRKNAKQKKANNEEKSMSSCGQQCIPESLSNEEGTLSNKKLKKNAVKKKESRLKSDKYETEMKHNQTDSVINDTTISGEHQDVGGSKDDSQDIVACMGIQNGDAQECPGEVVITNNMAEENTKKVNKKIVKKNQGGRRPKEDWSYFLQKGDCKSVPQMNPCRECRKYEREEDAIMMQSCCRFSMFRRCRTKRNKMEVAGFLCSDNAQSDDFKPWIACDDVANSLTLEMSKYILRNVGDEFCNLVKQEKEAILLSDNKENMAWKRAVCGIREMCDACATTIFNVHWVCAKCGFGVCLDCYKTKIYPQSNTVDGKKPKFLWVRCTPNSWHRPQKLLLAHIIPKQTLFEVGDELHKAREFWGIGENCPCKSHTTGVKSLIKVQGACENEKCTVDRFKEIAAIKKENKLDEHKSEQEKNSDDKMATGERLAINMDVGDKVVMNMVKGDTRDNAISKDKVVVHMDSDDELDTLGNDTMGALSLVMDYISPMSTPPMSPVNLMDIDIMALATPAEAILASRPSATSAESSSTLESLTDEPRDHPSSDQPDLSNNAPTERISSTEWEPDVCENQAKTTDTEPMNTEAEVTTNNAKVIDSNAEVTPNNADSNPKVTLNNAEITLNNAEVTSNNAEVTSNNAEVTSKNAKVTDNNAEVTSHNADGNAEVTSHNADGNAEVTSNNADDNVEITSNNADGNAGITSNNADVSESNAEVADSPTLSISDDQMEVGDCGPAMTEELPAPHSWMCTRPMLRLHDAQHEGNLKSFQSRWGIGEPVVVSNVNKRMNQKLWTPDVFAEEFGNEKADVVNCKNGTTIEKLDIGTFWRGFESVKDRPLDNKGESTLLKLKDWPPEADFLYKMPKRFEDLNNALPLPEYTMRTGSRNLVSRLPNFFVKPDLGPKMYNAYGNAAFPSAGTTNLHIDMSDAVNVMVYVGVPKDKDYGDQERRDTLSCVDASCDSVQQIRAREPDEQVGALWHIFAAEDANTIRKFFHKLVKEKNMKYPSNHDPIHDQCFYLDEPLLKRLKDEYGVVGWPIAQFLGDAVFIPAGAPHQVRNLHSCVKVAEDFVSPEHVGHCFELTQEFRHLSDKHTNHEDKLQVKNIIYHAVKDAVNVLRYHERALRTTSENERTTDDVS